MGKITMVKEEKRAILQELKVRFEGNNRKCYKSIRHSNRCVGV